MPASLFYLFFFRLLFPPPLCRIVYMPQGIYTYFISLSLSLYIYIYIPDRWRYVLVNAGERDAIVGVHPRVGYDVGSVPRTVAAVASPRISRTFDWVPGHEPRPRPALDARDPGPHPRPARLREMPSIEEEMRQEAAALRQVFEVRIAFPPLIYQQIRYNCRTCTALYCLCSA